MRATEHHGFLRAVSVLMALPLFLAGCGQTSGPERAEVTGKVTFQGQPLQEGTIAFIPAEGTEGPSSGAKIENGTYFISADSGPVVGTHRVEIRSMQRTGNQVSAQMPGETGGPSGGVATADEIKQLIPAEYNTQSKLTAKIKPGANEGVDFEL